MSRSHALERCTGDLDTGAEVFYLGLEWTVDSKTDISDPTEGWDTYTVKLHRRPGWHEDALSEDWLDVEAEGSDGWVVLV